MKRQATKTTKDPWQRIYAADLVAWGLPAPVAEHVFSPVRRYRFDVAWPAYRVAVEREGGIYQGGGTRCECCKQPIGGAHRAVKGILKDMEKQNEAARCGWFVLRFPPDELYKDASRQVVREVLINRGWRPNGSTSRSGGPTSTPTA